MVARKMFIKIDTIGGSPYAARTLCVSYVAGYRSSRYRSKHGAAGHRRFSKRKELVGKLNPYACALKGAADAANCGAIPMSSSSTGLSNWCFPIARMCS